MVRLLEVENLAVAFGGVAALQGVSFSLDEGELLGLIGPNGAGKTTALRVITGSVVPDAGRIALAGRELGGMAVHQRVRAGLGLSQQLVRPFRGMTVLENVMLAAGRDRTASPLRALIAHDRADERHRASKLLALVGIADAADARPSELPLGVLKRLEVARALALEPRILLLDEPLAGLNHVEARKLADTITALNREGLSIVLIEHNLTEVLRICPRLVVLDNGRVLGDGAAAEVMADPEVRAAYLGEAVARTAVGHA